MDGRREAHREVLVAVSGRAFPVQHRSANDVVCLTGRGSKPMWRVRPAKLDDLQQILDIAGTQGARLSSTLPKTEQRLAERIDRKSTRLNSSHVRISYAVFCLKKKK